jgi:hypothetical protein
MEQRKYDWSCCGDDAAGGVLSAVGANFPSPIEDPLQPWAALE